ncbi:hypothetical protein GCM10009546_01880 [Actinomadura livida]|uniref:Uncharacterized protein n=1 Tax=Actinomadura livida TaxID=79909 RepID=A0ABP3NFI2_9ACTN|nr:hypothetical protein GCM10010208_28120 [Actinomadura livida]
MVEDITGLALGLARECDTEQVVGPAGLELGAHLAVAARQLRVVPEDPSRGVADAGHVDDHRVGSGVQERAQPVAEQMAAQVVQGEGVLQFVRGLPAFGAHPVGEQRQRVDGPVPLANVGDDPFDLGDRGQVRPQEPQVRVGGLVEQGASPGLAAADHGDVVAPRQPFQGDRPAHAGGATADDDGLGGMVRHGVTP